MSNSAVKRRHVFINKAFQGRFIATIFFLILLSGLCSAFLIYGLTGSDLQAQSQAAHINIANAADHLGMTILIGNAVAILFASLVSVMVAIYASHKIAGPLYRFEKLCEQIGDGELNAVTTLREKDQLQPLATAFTKMVEKLRQRRQARQTHILLINEQIETLKFHTNLIGKQQEMLDALSHSLEQLKEDAANYN